MVTEQIIEEDQKDTIPENRLISLNSSPVDFLRLQLRQTPSPNK